MPLPKPTKKPEWASGGSAAIIEPGSAKKALGWIVEKPPHQTQNWLSKLYYDWVNYFEDKTDITASDLAAESTARSNADGVEATTRAAADVAESAARASADNLIATHFGLAYDAIVGSSGAADYPTIAEALAAASAGWRILVASNQVLNTNLNVAVAGIELELKNGVTVSKGTAATGIMVSASGFTLRGGTLSGFTNAAVVVGSAGTSSMFRDIRFAGNTLDIDDPNDLADILGCI